MPQPVSYNPGIPVSGSIQENNISYVVDGQQRNYRGGFGGLSWMSEVPAENNVIFIGNSTSLGRGPANIPLFYPSYNNSSANIVYAANTLPGSPRNFTTTASAYNWAVTNNFFINNSDNPIPRIDADGLVLYVDANQASSYPQTGTTWYDISGYGNNGTLINGVGFDSATGTLVFDGSNDGINLTNNFSGSTENNVTVECIVKLDTNQTSRIFASNYNGSSGATGFALGINDSLTNRVKWFTGNLGTTNTLTSTTTLTNGRYYHTVGTYNGSSKVLYLNGVSEASTTVSNIINNTSTLASIGYLRPSNLQYLDGNIENVKFYSKALTAAEVAQNYYGGPIVTDGLVFAVDANNLVSYPKSGTAVYNLTGSDPGTLLNGTGFNVSNGGIFSFDGVNDYILQDNNNTNCNPGLTNDITIECWSNPTFPTSSTLYSVAGKMGGVRNGWMVGWNNGTAYATFRNSDANYSVATIDLGTNVTADNQWHHIIATLDRDVGAKIYVDGELKTSVLSTKTQGYDLNTSTRLVIGRFSEAFAYPMNGDIGDVRVYNRELSPSEVFQNYEATKDKFQGQQIVTQGLVLNLDSADKDSYPGTGTTWTDLSGNGNNGTLTNGPSFLSNENGGIMRFDGVDDYARITPPTNYSEYTIHFFCQWISSVGFNERLFGSNAFGTYTIFNPLNVGFHYNPLGGSPPSVTLSSGVNVGFGNWCQVAVTVSTSSPNVIIYVNGIARNSWNVIPSQNLYPNLYLGAQNTLLYANCYFGGFQLYNRVLSATEVAQNFNAQKSRFGL